MSCSCVVLNYRLIHRTECTVISFRAQFHDQFIQMPFSAALEDHLSGCVVDCGLIVLFGVQNVPLRSVTVTFCALLLAAVRELGPKVQPRTETAVWTVSALTKKQREQSKIENKKESIKRSIQHAYKHLS